MVGEGLYKESFLWYNSTAVDIGHHPELIHPTAYVAPNATVVGEVHVAARASIWFGCVLRGDNAPIIIGDSTNVQDLSLIHTDEGEPCTLGGSVVVGREALVGGMIIPPRHLAMGVPAQVVRALTDEEVARTGWSRTMSHAHKHFERLLSIREDSYVSDPIAST